MEDRHRFTTDQALRGIQAYVDERFGVHFPLNPDVPLSEYSELVSDEVGCPLEFLQGLGIYFGLRWSDRRWAVWLRLPRARRIRTLSREERERHWDNWVENTSQSRTIRNLAEYLARHAKGISMDPVSVFGNHCAPAGAFLGICHLPELCGRRVAPSTRIRQVLGATCIEAMLRRANWISGAKIKAQRRFSLWSDPIPHCMIPVVLVVFPGIPLLLGGLAAHLPFSPMVVIGVAVVLSFALLWRTNDRLRNPLPDGVETFGDLARLIAGGDTRAA